MNGYNKQYITRADFQSLASMRIPYTGFIKGEGYAYTTFGFVPPAHQQRVSPPNRVPYNQSFTQTTLTQYIDKSPEAQVRSLNIQPDDLVKLLVTKRPGGGYNINMGNGRYEQVSAESELIRTITDTPSGMKYEIGYLDKTTGKGKTTSGYLREMHITFASTADQMPPLEIPGEINLSASKVLMELPTKEKAAANDGGSVGQPGTWESMIPIWGSGRAAVDHFENGNYWRGAGYTALAISDVFLVKSIGTGVAKGGVKMLGKSYKTWGSFRTNYGKTGFAAPNQQLHHWAWARDGATSGEGFNWWAKNQMWNLMPMESQAMHTAVHGWGRNAYGLGGQFWYGTPTWFKASIVSGGGRLAD